MNEQLDHHSAPINSKREQHQHVPIKNTMSAESIAAGTKQIACRFPRVFYFLLQLVLPLLVLISMAFLFGWALATLESPDELDANDVQVRDTFKGYLDYEAERLRVREGLRTAPETCLSSFENENNNGTSTLLLEDQLLLDHLNRCANYTAEKFEVLDFVTYWATVLDWEIGMTFEWSQCGMHDYSSEIAGENVSKADRAFLLRNSNVKQTKQFIDDFFADFEELNAALPSDSTEEDILNNLELATGSKSCKPHIAGGTLFWFTIMTTIGYGNVAPTTDGGRLLVYTGGFVSVVGFLFLNASASFVVLTLVDDALIRIRQRWLTRGLPACLFWLVLLVGWIFVLAGTAMRWAKQELGVDFAFEDASWFSYITILTIGLGDYHIDHEDFEPHDMFYIPLVVLLGFVIVGNFAAKVVDTVSVWLPDEGNLETILKATQPKEEDEWTPTERFLKEQADRDTERSSRKQRLHRRRMSI